MYSEANNAAGAAQSNINGTKLGEFKVPLPELSAQEEIVGEMNSLSNYVSSFKSEIK